MLKLINNSTNSQVSIVINGEVFSVNANGNVMVDERIAKEWVKTHGFLSISDVSESKSTKEETNVTVEESNESKSIVDEEETKVVKSPKKSK